MADTEPNKERAVYAGLVSVFLLSIILLAPMKSARMWAWVTLYPSGLLFFFFGASFVSSTLTGEARRWFQVAVCVAAPIMMSLYFIKDAPVITLESATAGVLSLWIPLPFAIIAFVSWHAAKIFNKDNPFRGCLIASTTIFVICYMGYEGINLGDDFGNVVYDDIVANAEARQTGRYFGQFLVYVLVSYTAMLTSLRKLGSS